MHLLPEVETAPDLREPHFGHFKTWSPSRPQRRLREAIFSFTAAQVLKLAPRALRRPSSARQAVFGLIGRNAKSEACRSTPEVSSIQDLMMLTKRSGSSFEQRAYSAWGNNVAIARLVYEKL
jgi:hypothetical protein